MKIIVLALLSVVFLDIMNQGLVFPLINTIVMNPAKAILPHATPTSTREFDYGLLMGAFYICWFFGAAYISRVSDMIGRKQGVLICLAGNLLGYVLTIVSLETSSFWLMLFARALAGFTAGNQPIAQAALVDISESEAQRTRYMGLILVAVSAGLVAGPLIGGLLSDKAVLGHDASVELPFYGVSGMIVVSLNLIFFFFHNKRTEREPFTFKLLDVFLTLWQAAKRPTVAKLGAVFFFGQIALNAFYIFMANYYYRRFGFDTLENAATLVVLGVGLGFGSAFLVTPINKRFGKRAIIAACLAVMGVSGLLSIVNPWPVAAYILILPSNPNDPELLAARVHPDPALHHPVRDLLPDDANDVLDRRGRERAGVGYGGVRGAVHPRRRPRLAPERRSDGDQHPYAVPDRRRGGDYRDHTGLHIVAGRRYPRAGAIGRRGRGNVRLRTVFAPSRSSGPRAS